PGPAFSTDVSSASLAKIFLEDQTGRLINDGDHDDGIWELTRESTVLTGAPDDPAVNQPFLPDVWIQPADAKPDEIGPVDGTFSVYRCSSGQALNVELFPSAGTALAEEEYDSDLPITVTIPAGEDHVDFSFTPVADEVV